MTSRQAKLQEDTYFRVMRILQENPDLTQRELAEKLGISVGGLNYCLKALMEKGLVKMKNFATSKNKFGYVYVLTPTGMAEKAAISTDKAVYPINAMGISKAMMEKVAVAKSRNSNSTVINVTRYGNVMCSRGSVIPLFTQQIRAEQPITITDPAMTRFMMTLDDAVDLVLYAFEHGKPGEIFVQKAPAATIETLAYALTDLLGKPKHEVRVIGTRHGEKLYEALLSREEMVAAEDLGGYYRVPPDLRDLNYGKFVEQGEVKISEASDYNSHNTTRLDVPGMQALLMKLRFMQATLRGEVVEAEE